MFVQHRRYAEVGTRYSRQDSFIHSLSFSFTGVTNAFSHDVRNGGCAARVRYAGLAGVMTMLLISLRQKVVNLAMMHPRSEDSPLVSPQNEHLRAAISEEQASC